MKKILLTIIIVSLTLNVIATDVVDNPAQPMTGPDTKKIGRTIKMTEVFRISDEDGDFFLKRPQKISVAPDGSIFLMDDSQSNLLKFNAAGKFVTTLMRKGQGPGELVNFNSYWLDDKEIVTSSLMPIKVVCMDHQGKLTKEFQVKSNEFIYYLVGRFNGKYYFYLNPLVRENGVVTVESPLMAADDKGVISKTGLTLPVKRVKVSYNKTVGDTLVTTIDRVEITRFNYAIGSGKYLYVTASEGYLIHQYDFEKDKVIRKFRRQYTRVPFRLNPNSKFAKLPKLQAIYKWEFFNDVYKLLAAGERVWAITSTIDKTKGILVDVFNHQGKYIDRFYLQYPNLEFPDDERVQHLYYHNGFLYTIEPDDEDNLYVVKYKLED